MDIWTSTEMSGFLTLHRLGAVKETFTGMFSTRIVAIRMYGPMEKSIMAMTTSHEG